MSLPCLLRLFSPPTTNSWGFLPILAATQTRLQQANSSEERRQIEQQFETAAAKVIAAHQLTPEDYHRISAGAQSDPGVAAAVTAAVRRWMSP